MKKILILMMLTFSIGISWANELYILGMVNGNGSQPNQGVMMTYDDKNDIYTADIWVIGNDQNDMGVPGTWFAFTTVLANDNDEGGWNYVNSNRYSPSPDYGNSYWLTNGPVSDVPLTKQNNGKAFLIPAGLYKITVSGDLSSFSLIEVKDLTPIISPDGGDLPLNTIVAVSLSENYNEFIAECNPVVDSSNKTVEITPPVAKLFVNDNITYSLYYEMILDFPGETTITGKGALIAGDTEYAAKTASKTYNVYQTFDAIIETSSINGGIVSFSATDPTNTTLLEIAENYVVNVYVTPLNHRELKTLTYTTEDGSTVDLLKNSYNEEEGCYSFNMPASNITINASFNYNGPEPTQTTYQLINKSISNAFEVGARYIIVNEDYKKALGGPTNSAVDITIGKDEHFTVISSDSDVAQFVLGENENGWTFQSEYGYLKLESTNFDISQYGNSDDSWLIKFDSYNENEAIINSSADRTRQICLSRNRRYFTTMSNGGRDFPVQIYKEVVLDEVTLAELVDPKGECVVDNTYKIEDDNLVAVELLPDGSLLCKDFNAYADQDDWNAVADDLNLDLSDPNKDPLSDYMKTFIPGGKAWTEYDQSNWIILSGKDISLNDLVGYKLKDVTGTLKDQINPKLEITSAPVAGDLVYKDGYIADTFIPAAFSGSNYQYYTWQEIWDDVTYDMIQYIFFVQPKPMELVHLELAKWDDNNFVTPTIYQTTNQGNPIVINLDGRVGIDYSYVGDPKEGDQLIPGTVYRLDGIVKKNKEKDGSYSVVLTKPIYSDTAVITAVEDLNVNVNSQVESVTYFNVSGMKSNKPFDGINIVVTRYTDGHISTSKIIK